MCGSPADLGISGEGSGDVAAERVSGGFCGLILHINALVFGSVWVPELIFQR